MKRNENGRRKRWTGVMFALATLLVALAVPAQAAERVEEIVLERGSVPLQLEVKNLAGSMQVRGWDGNTRIRVTFHAEDSGGLTAEEILQLVGAEARMVGNRLVVSTTLPLESFQRYAYPVQSTDSDSDPGYFNLARTSGFSEARFGGEKVEIYGTPQFDALTVWADYKIIVPEGSQVSLKNMAGTLRAENMQGNILLDGSRGLDQPDEAFAKVLHVTAARHALRTTPDSGTAMDNQPPRSLAGVFLCDNLGCTQQLSRESKSEVHRRIFGVHTETTPGVHP